MRLVVDENCADKEFLVRLRSSGHDAETVVGAVGAGAQDSAVVTYALATRRAIVTKNAKDFRALLGTHEKHPGLTLIFDDSNGPRPSVASLVQSIDNVATTTRYSNPTSSFSTSFGGDSQLMSEDGFQSRAWDEADQFATLDCYARASGMSAD